MVNTTKLLIPLTKKKINHWKESILTSNYPKLLLSNILENTSKSDSSSVKSNLIHILCLDYLIRLFKNVMRNQKKIIGKQDSLYPLFQHHFYPKLNLGSSNSSDSKNDFKKSKFIRLFNHIMAYILCLNNYEIDVSIVEEDLTSKRSEITKCLNNIKCRARVREAVDKNKESNEKSVKIIYYLQPPIVYDSKKKSMQFETFVSPSGENQQDPIAENEDLTCEGSSNNNISVLAPKSKVKNY